MTITVRDRGATRIRKQLAELSRLRVLVGVQGEEAARPHPNSDETIGTIAKWLHYGTAKQPARPYVDRAIAAARGKIGESVVASVRDLVASRYVSVPDAARPLGELMTSLVRHEFDTASEWAAPLAESTVARKGHDVPLVETYAVRDAITYAITDGATVVAKGRGR